VNWAQFWLTFAAIAGERPIEEIFY
jgi:hypothetical protein